MQTAKNDFDWREVGDRVRDLRLALRISGNHLAQRANLTHSSLLRIESGSINPQVETLQRIARALGCSVRDLVCGPTFNAALNDPIYDRVRRIVESGDPVSVSALAKSIEIVEALLQRRGLRRSDYVSRVKGRPRGLRIPVSADQVERLKRLTDPNVATNTGNTVSKAPENLSAQTLGGKHRAARSRHSSAKPASSQEGGI